MRLSVPVDEQRTWHSVVASFGSTALQLWADGMSSEIVLIVLSHFECLLGDTKTLAIAQSADWFLNDNQIVVAAMDPRSTNGGFFDGRVDTVLVLGAEASPQKALSVISVLAATSTKRFTDPSSPSLSPAPGCPAYRECR